MNELLKRAQLIAQTLAEEAEEKFGERIKEGTMTKEEAMTQILVEKNRVNMLAEHSLHTSDAICFYCADPEEMKSQMSGEEDPNILYGNR